MNGISRMTPTFKGVIVNSGKIWEERNEKLINVESNLKTAGIKYSVIPNSKENTNIVLTGKQREMYNMCSDKEKMLAALKQNVTQIN